MSSIKKINNSNPPLGRPPRKGTQARLERNGFYGEASQNIADAGSSAQKSDRKSKIKITKCKKNDKTDCHIVGLQKGNPKKQHGRAYKFRFRL